MRGFKALLWAASLKPNNRTLTQSPNNYAMKNNAKPATSTPYPSMIYRKQIEPKPHWNINVAPEQNCQA